MWRLFPERCSVSALHSYADYIPYLMATDDTSGKLFRELYYFVMPLGRRFSMLHLTQFVATISCAIFAGAAIYINLVEHPAHMSCGTQIAATVWAPIYKRATVMQAPLAILSFLAGVSSWLLGGGIIWFAGAVLIGLVVPFTLIAIMSTNRQLLAHGRDLSSTETRALLIKWSWLHAVRSLLGLLALVVYLILLLQA
jgi:anthrone oxygenase-like protein